MEAAGAGDDAEASARMGAAVLAAETASDAALVGRIALRRGALGAVFLAVHRATELGAGDARGAFLAAQLAYARGDLARVGDGSLLPGGALAHLNFLEPHLATILGFIGLTELTFIRAGYEEYQDARLKRSLAAAEAAVDETAARLAGLAIA